MSGKITIGSAQFSITGSITTNAKKIEEQIIEASELGCNIVHFCECCLTGYPDIDIKNCHGSPEIAISLERISQLAAKNDIWVIVGTHFFVPEQSKPFNSLFVYNNSGQLVTRYDKRILAGRPGESDLAHYAAGNKPGTFEINGIKCGLLICHEWRYPELFREYKQLGVELIFHSFYDGNLNNADYKNEGIELGELITGGERYNAANNYLWLSVSNTSQTEQTFPSMVIHPDGSIAKQANRNKQQIIVSEIDLALDFVDPSRFGRKHIAGLFPNGTLKQD